MAPDAPARTFLPRAQRPGDRSPPKTVLDIMPMETDTIEFHASETLWRLVFSLPYPLPHDGRHGPYSVTKTPNLIPPWAIPKKALRIVYRDDRRFYYTAQVGLESNGSDGEMTLANTRWVISTEWRLGLTAKKDSESETHIGRAYRAQSMADAIHQVSTGATGKHDEAENLFGQRSTRTNGLLYAGVQYTLPMLIRTDARIDTEGKIRVQFEGKTSHLHPIL